MNSLPSQPLQVGDFSGGITENFVASPPTRYMAADNFLVTVDKKLEERYGSVLLDPTNFRLPSGNGAVNALIPHDNEAYLLGVSLPNVYVLNPNWATILGPTGNPPLAGGASTNAVSWGEFAHTTLATDDSLGTKPVKIYRGYPYPIPLAMPLANNPTLPTQAQLNTFNAVTAGLPALIGPPNIDPTILLAKAITLANDLKTQMLAHMGDAAGVPEVDLHAALDSTDISILNAAANASNLATLFTLITALISAYTGHVSEVVFNNYGTTYHFPFLSNTALNFYLSNIVTPTTLLGAATILDDLKTKFFMHEMAIFTHSEDNTYAVIGKYLVTTPHIGTVSTGPIIVPNYSLSISYVNSVKSSYNAHVIDTSYHKSADTLRKVSFPNALDLDTLYILIAHIRAQYTNHLADSVSGFTYHYSPANADTTNEYLLPGNGGGTSSFLPLNSNLGNWVALLSIVGSSYGFHDGNGTVHHNSFQHPVEGIVPTISNYAYALHYFYQYMRFDGVIFDVVGPPVLLGPISTETITPSVTVVNPISLVSEVLPASTVTINNIPILVNDAASNYDTGNLQIKIFRTIDSGTTYLTSGIINNGTVVFTDTIVDNPNPYLQPTVYLSVQPPIYTSGGVVAFDPAPVSKYLTILQGTAYFGAVVDTGQTFLNRIRQSIQNNIDSSPGSFFVDLPDNLMGLSSTRNNLVALCSNSIHQLSGAFNQLGQGQINSQFISDTIGCVSSESIVKTDVGIFFAGTDGFYYTDGFQLVKVSSELNLTYAALVSNATQKAAIYGCYDRYNRRVWWTTQPDLSDQFPSQSYIFHVNFGVTAHGVFTTASNFENYRPTSMIFWQGRQIRGDARGYLFVHTVDSKTDPKVNLQVTATSWNTVYIPYNYSSCALDFGTTFNRKWLTRISLQGENIGNVGALITSISDQGRVPPRSLSPVWFHSNIQWGQPNIVWGASNNIQPIIWGDNRQMDVWRRFPATQLRADFKQIKITPAYIGVYRYEDWPIGALAVITPSGVGTATVRILSPSPYTQISWPLDIIDYNFAQQGDNYVAEYPITAISTTTHTNDTFTVTDTSNVLTSSTVMWVLRGVMKQQRLSITSYAIHFSLLGKMQQAFQGQASAGENV